MARVPAQGLAAEEQVSRRARKTSRSSRNLTYKVKGINFSKQDDFYAFF
jgi:hypothetical protein